MPYYQEIGTDISDKAAVEDYEEPVEDKVADYYEQPTDKMMTLADYEQPTDKMATAADYEQPTETVADYEQPMTKLNKNNSTKNNDIIQHNNDVRVDMVEPYQEPIDALKWEVWEKIQTRWRIR